MKKSGFGGSEDGSQLFEKTGKRIGYRDMAKAAQPCRRNSGRDIV